MIQIMEKIQPEENITCLRQSIQIVLEILGLKINSIQRLGGTLIRKVFTKILL